MQDSGYGEFDERGGLVWLSDEACDHVDLCEDLECEHPPYYLILGREVSLGWCAKCRAATHAAS